MRAPDRRPSPPTWRTVARWIAPLDAVGCGRRMRVKRPHAYRACRVVPYLDYFYLYLRGSRLAKCSGSQLLSRVDRGFATSNGGRSNAASPPQGAPRPVCRSTVSERGRSRPPRGGDRFAPALRKARTSQDLRLSSRGMRLLNAQLRHVLTERQLSPARRTT